MKIEEISIRRIDRRRRRDRERKRDKTTVKRYLRALLFFSFDVSRSSFSSFPRDDDDLNFPNVSADGAARETSNHHHHHRVVVALEKKRSTEWREKRERERDKEREKVIRTFFMCVCVFMRVVRALECLCL